MDKLIISYDPMVGKLKDYQPLSFLLVNGTEDERIWNHMVHTWHYLGYQSMIGPRVKYLVLSRGIPIAAISFNQASLRLGVRDTWLGWNDEYRQAHLSRIVNNNRFLILPWIRIKNLASHILAKSLQLLKDDWFRLYGIKPYAVETFVDFNRYQGICYKAANWRYLGETRGFGKIGKTFVYHGNRKGVFFYIFNRKLIRLLSLCPRRPNPKPDRTGEWLMMLSIPDWSKDLFAKIGLNEQTVAALGQTLTNFLNAFSSCFSNQAQQQNGELYIKGLLSDLDRKSIEPIALRYVDEKTVRTLQFFLKESPWDDPRMKQDYQGRVCAVANDPNGMLTIDGSDFAKKGTESAGVYRQYCGSKGKVENCQAGVFIGYSGANGYGLLDSRLYLPQAWFEPKYKARWAKCDIPVETEFRTKPQIALAMIQEAVKDHGFQFKWVGCDGAFGCDAEFRSGLPENVFFFADVHSNQYVFKERPEWAIPEKKGKRGKQPTKLVPSVPAVPVSSIAEDTSLPWEEIVLMEGSKGPVHALVKYCRIIEQQDGKDGDELWLYIRKYEDGKIKYSFSDAPADIDIQELHHAATLRWPIEQSFQECKSYLGMADYETRSYLGWHRHMLLVMVAHLFVLEVRHQFQKKTKTGKVQSCLHCVNH